MCLRHDGHPKALQYPRVVSPICLSVQFCKTSLALLNQDLGERVVAKPTITAESNRAKSSVRGLTCGRITVRSFRYWLLAQVRLVVPNTVLPQGHCNPGQPAPPQQPTFAPRHLGHPLHHEVAGAPQVADIVLQPPRLGRLQGAGDVMLPWNVPVLLQLGYGD